MILVIHYDGQDVGARARGLMRSKYQWWPFEAKGDANTKSVAVWVRRQKNAASREAPFCYEGKPVGLSLFLGRSPFPC